MTTEYEVEHDHIQYLDADDDEPSFTREEACLAGLRAAHNVARIWINLARQYPRDEIRYAYEAEKAFKRARDYISLIRREREDADSA